MTQRMGSCGKDNPSRVGIQLWMDLKEVIWFLWPLDLIPFMLSQMQSRLLRQPFCHCERKKVSDMNWFGWCTWDAFYTDVTAEGVRNGLESLGKGGIILEFVIIDDG